MADELTELLAKATPVEIKDDAGWSLSLCFGHGDKGRDAMRQFCDTLIAQSKADAARIAALEEALRFYARPQSWRSSGVYMSGRSQATAAEIDGGDRARAALETTRMTAL